MSLHLLKKCLCFIHPVCSPSPSACGLDMDMEKVFPPTHEEPPPYPGSPPYPSLSPHVSPPLPPSVPHYAEADIVSLQGVSGNNTYAVPALASSSPGADATPLPELPRQCLIFKEKLGEGQFGEVWNDLMKMVCVWGWKGDCALTMSAFFRQKVHLCEIESPQDLPNLEFPFNVRKGRPLLVAVKILRPDASKNARYTAGFSVVHDFSSLLLQYLLLQHGVIKNIGIFGGVCQT